MIECVIYIVMHCYYVFMLDDDHMTKDGCEQIPSTTEEDKVMVLSLVQGFKRCQCWICLEYEVHIGY